MKRALFMAILIVMLPVCFASSLTYDANGNLVTGDGNYRVYNGLNQLVQIRNGSTASSPLLQEFVHHPVHERVLVKKTYLANGSVGETVYYFSEQNVRIVNESGTFDVKYIFHQQTLLAEEVNGVRHYVHSDPGSNIQKVLTDTSGDTIETVSFDPFGSVTSGGDVSRKGYEDKTSSHAGVDFNFRNYNPEWGLFLQPDSILPDAFDPQQLNRYAFERNSPINNIDPDGHSITLGFVYGAVMATAIVVAVAIYAMNYYEVKDQPLGSSDRIAVNKQMIDDMEDILTAGTIPEGGPSRVVEAVTKTADVMVDMETMVDLLDGDDDTGLDCAGKDCVKKTVVVDDENTESKQGKIKNSGGGGRSGNCYICYGEINNNLESGNPKDNGKPPTLE